MTDEQWEEIGRRAVACKGWRWLPGMLARYSNDAWYRVTECDSIGIPRRARLPNPRFAWPDLRDPATLGCLLALVREIHGATVHTTPDNTGCGWWVEGLPGIGIIHATEAGALVAALKAAP